MNKEGTSWNPAEQEYPTLMPHPLEYPRLRPVEVIPLAAKDGAVALRDPSGLAAGIISAPPHLLTLFARMDGRHRRLDLQGIFTREFGQLLLSEDLDALLEQLDQAGFLEGEGFDRYYAGLVSAYQHAPRRPLRDRDGFGAPASELRTFLDAILDERPPRDDTGGETATGPSSRVNEGVTRERLLGLIAPHLDYPRGRPCYGASYRRLREGPRPERVVILGTNHFGRSSAVVATGKAFETPFGIVENDPEFLARLEMECDASLREWELDHAREHSVELQVVWLHHLLGDGVRMVPFLCPDPSGPTGTAPWDGSGVDLRRFAEALGRLIREESAPTLILASADLSHIGTYFSDRRGLDDAYLQEVSASDEAALLHVDANDPEGLREHFSSTGNPTRVCSVGCIYALLTALGSEARAVRLGYHQAVTREIDNAVSCTAYAFYVQD
jgi:AmmeMemoRadiSam system protein B